MQSALLEAVASSTAHGISRAAGSRAAPLKVMWILLFALFLAMFLKSGIDLVLKLRENKLTKIYHLDQVPFMFPDLYFCPNNPYSGSYPHMLTKSEAQHVNSEIARIIGLYRSLNVDLPSQANSYKMAFTVQMSLPVHLIVNHLAVRLDQSVMRSRLYTDYNVYWVDLEPFYHPENIICFRAILTAEQKRMMRSVNSALEIWLSTDPFFADFNFTGHPIQPIVDDQNQSVSFIDWHPTPSTQGLKVSGYKMLIVPPGTYPFLSYESNFQLAPGNAYTVKLEMEENACSEELHRTHCVNDHPKVGFIDPLTRQAELFNYSSNACFYRHRNFQKVKRLGCQSALEPWLLEFQDKPRCRNVSETNATLLTNMLSIAHEDDIQWDIKAAEYCRRRIPCYYPQYNVKFSFGKWPGIGSSTDKYFAAMDFNETVTPAWAKLVGVAQQIQSKNHSGHLEGIFRSYLSESMINVRISSASVMSPQVMLTLSYTVTDFLADTGGLLGLYIGCSVLTLCELLELFYVLVDHVLRRKPKAEAAPGPPDDGDPSKGAGSDVEQHGSL